MCLSEHPFGTLKRIQGSYYFLLRGNRKTQGEFGKRGTGRLLFSRDGCTIHLYEPGQPTQDYAESRQFEPF